MNKEKKPWKNHRICMKCRVQSTGNSVKECVETFPRCGLNGGIPNDACKTTIYQDGDKVFELIPTAELAKIQKALETKQTTSAVKPVTATKTTPKKASKKQTNSKTPKN